MRSKLARKTTRFGELEDEDNYNNKKETGFLFKEFYFRMPGLSIINIIKLIFFIIIISPWIYIFARNGSFRQLSDKVISFYDEKFIISNGMVNITEEFN
jgi:hypothetical protein